MLKGPHAHCHDLLLWAAMHYRMALHPFDVVCVKSETQPLCSAVLAAAVLAEHAACSRSS